MTFLDLKHRVIMRQVLLELHFFGCRRKAKTLLIPVDAF